MLNFHHEQIVWFARYNPYIRYDLKAVQPVLCYIDDIFICRDELLLVLRRLEDEDGVGKILYAKISNDGTRSDTDDIVTKTHAEAVDLYNRAIDSVINNYNNSLEYVLPNLDLILFYSTDDLSNLPRPGRLVPMEELVSIEARAKKYYYIREEWSKPLKLTIPRIKETFYLRGGSYVSPSADFVYFLAIHPDDYGTNIFSMFFPTIKDAYQIALDHMDTLKERIKNQVQHKIELLNKKKLI